MVKRPWLIAVPVVLGAGLAIWTGVQVLRNRPAAQVPITPVVTEVKAIAALGRLEPRGEVYTLSAPSSIEGNRVAELRVREGDGVTAGQILAALDTATTRRAELAEAQGQLAIAQATLAQVKAGAKTGDLQAQRAAIARLEAEFRIAQTNLNRNRQLFEEGAISATQFDDARLQVDTLTEQLRQARATLVSLAEVRDVDVKLAEAEVRKAQAQVLRAEKNLDLTYVRAPLDGQVLKVHTKIGETVGDTGILDLGQTQRMDVVAEVYETDISRVRVGQRAVITAAALPQPIQGTVSQVGLRIAKKDVLDTDPVAETDARVVEVKIQLDPAASRLVQNLTNMQVSVQIQLDS